MTVAELRAKHSGLPCYYVQPTNTYKNGQLWTHTWKQLRAYDTDVIDSSKAYVYGPAPVALFPKQWTNRICIFPTAGVSDD